MLLAVMRHPAILLYLAERPVGRAGQPGRPAGASRAEREPGARVPGTAHAQPGCRLHPGRCDELRPHPDRLVGRPARRAMRASGSAASPTSRGLDGDGPQRSRPARQAARRRCASWPTIRRRTGSSPPSWCGISSPMTPPAGRGRPDRGRAARHRRRARRRGGGADRAAGGVAAGDEDSRRRRSW